jgi:hypothetical protein
VVDPVARQVGWYLDGVLNRYDPDRVPDLWIVQGWQPVYVLADKGDDRMSGELDQMLSDAHEAGVQAERARHKPEKCPVVTSKVIDYVQHVDGTVVAAEITVDPPRPLGEHEPRNLVHAWIQGWNDVLVAERLRSKQLADEWRRLANQFNVETPGGSDSSATWLRRLADELDFTVGGATPFCEGASTRRPSPDLTGPATAWQQPRPPEPTGGRLGRPSVRPESTYAHEAGARVERERIIVHVEQEKQSWAETRGTSARVARMDTLDHLLEWLREETTE